MSQTAEEEEAGERSSPTSSVVYHAILEEGETELGRSSAALAWSGLAAGLSMGFSFLATALLHSKLPHGEKWVPLVASLGYSVGFLIVILGRQQLFTETTLTAVLPLLDKRKASIALQALRLWAIVLVANTAGAMLFALVLAKTELVGPEMFEAMRTVAKEAAAHMPSFGVTLLRGFFAGWLIALLVWLLPFAESARVTVIIIITWVVGAAHFSHIIAGVVDSAFLAFHGDSSWAQFLFDFYIPTLIGNTLGGVSLVAALNYAQATAGKSAEAE
ncbi:MAG TPA: formate/nitrite transporter family protein [Thermoanaerobaculia bacterium]|nr:formate/nitrite transporter family protein [Thermoanaerobaculia bacterium]